MSTAAQQPVAYDDSKGGALDQNPTEFSSSDSDTLSLDEKNEREVQQHPGQITRDAQLGVAKAEAAALVWSKPAVISIYAWIWVCFFVLALQQSVGNTVIYNAYSGFAAAPQVATAGILANIIGGILKLPIAKLLNIWGRAEGFLTFVGVYLIGIIVIASASGPNSYAAGYTLYYIGFDSIFFILDVFVADTSGLRFRAFAFAFSGTPYICTAFVGPIIGQRFLDHSTWRWAWGSFAIITPCVFVPLAVALKFYQTKAERLGVYRRERSDRTVLQSALHYIDEFGIVGAFLLIAAFVLFLLPFSLEQFGQAGYRSPTFIAMIVIGFLLFFVFAAWERWFARVHFVRWELFRQRSVLGACVSSAVRFFSFYCWDLYFFYFTQVAYNLSITNSGYMSQIYNVGTTVTGPIFGLYIYYAKRFKYATLFFGLPLMFLGAGLQIKYRGEDPSDIGLLVMCQIFISVSGGILVIADEMAVMASSDREGVPMMLALVQLSASVGGAIGDSVAAAINANVFPRALARRLPSGQQANVNTIFLGGSTTALTYPVGTPTRDAINYAYSQVQLYGSIAATAILVLEIPSIAVWKNFYVDKKQNKGTVL